MFTFQKKVFADWSMGLYEYIVSLIDNTMRSPSWYRTTGCRVFYVKKNTTPRYLLAGCQLVSGDNVKWLHLKTSSGRFLHTSVKRRFLNWYKIISNLPELRNPRREQVLETILPPSSPRECEGKLETNWTWTSNQALLDCEFFKGTLKRQSE